MGRFIFRQAPSSQCCLPHLECLDASDWSDLDNIKGAIDTNSRHSQTCGLGKVRGTKVMEAFGLSNIYYILGILRADGVMVDGWNHHPQTHPLEGNFLGDQTRRVFWPADSHRDVLVPWLNSTV